MNTETGALYYGAPDIAAALLRGEPVVEVSDQVANLIELGKTRFDTLPTAESLTMEDLKRRIEALENAGETERRMKALGLVVP